MNLVHQVDGMLWQEGVGLRVGRGRFDQHKGDENDCAASLVFKHLPLSFHSHAMPAARFAWPA